MTTKMPKKRKILNIGKKCRLCLRDHGCMSNIFVEWLEPKIKDLVKCTSIDIKDEEDFPKNICHVCLYKLDMWSEFKEQFVRSNVMLVAHLDLPETSDHGAPNSKRKHIDFQQSGDNSPCEHVEKKKLKSEIPPLIPLEFASVDCVADQSVLKEMYISEDEPVTAASKNAQPVRDNQEDEVKKEDDVQPQVKPTLVPMKVKHISASRGRTTERRKASTKRWVARKKALLAATGEHASDTDSIISDDTQLSPVQKARAKTNADKEADRHKRLAKALKHLETDMTGKYGIKHDSDSIVFADTDSDARRTRSQKTLITEVSQKENKNLDSMKQGDKLNEANFNQSKNLGSMKQGDKLNDANFRQSEVLNKTKLRGPVRNERPSLALANNLRETKKQDKILNFEDKFNPQCIRSELEIGDATYIVTSTLVLSEPHYSNKTNLNNLSKDGGVLSFDDSQERNTDIIDAVQLRRVNPKSSTDINNEKKFIERCLNIEVEGTELEALQRVQAELATFVEKDMKYRLLNTDNGSAVCEKVENQSKDSFQTLDQQLKTIVEKAIKKNLESSKAKKVPINKVRGSSNQITKTFSSKFVKAAMHSKIFQPKVLLLRLDINKVSKLYQINNIHLLNYQKPKTKFNKESKQVLGKRQIVQPARYSEFTTLSIDSENSTLSQHKVVTSTPKPARFSNIKPYGPASAKQAAMRKSKAEEIKVQRKEKSACETMECDTTTKTLPASKKMTVLSEKAVNGESNSTPEITGNKRHICGVCGEYFNDKKEVEIHVKTHKIDSPALKQNKHRIMRCKRCHEIVEARYVKEHVCRSSKYTHKCYVCNSIFRTEKMLTRHLQMHDESEFNVDSVKREENKNVSSVSSTQNNTQNNLVEEKIEKVPISKPKQTYTCFVCDKIFTDEEVLKDHLQKHCDDISEDEQSIEKEQFQCAICGDTLESEDALESHVEKHLFDDEDDNPNLISIGTDNEKVKEDLHKCTECSKEFNSQMLLIMHMQAHEEEAAIAEWEKREMKVSQDFICLLCDDVFETENELAAHLDVHSGDSHVCFLCEKPFSKLEDLQMHVATHV